MNNSAPPHIYNKKADESLFPELLPAIDATTCPGPVIIAGPCSAENEQQVMETACHLANIGVSAFRAGVWKPRTHPGCFEGRGADALRWISDAGRKTGIMTATEVASAQHLEEALDNGIDILWLGARTTTNPFAVQEIADAARDWANRHNVEASSLRFLVKNPANQDLELWIGAIQRLYNAGIRRLTAIHRGFSVYGNQYYRNPPQWQIPMELRRRVGASLQILSDPSHIGGKRELVEPIARQALSRGFDGLIIEVHPHPEEALSDSGQQITPAELEDMLRRLTRNPGKDDGDKAELASLRGQIDQIDDELMTLIQKRMEVAREIGIYKKSHSMTVVQPDRYENLITRRVAEAESLGLSPDFIRALLAAIHEESVRQQLS